MAWEGYIEYDGAEVINVARTEAYARRFPGFRPIYGNDSLPYMLGAPRGYSTPLQDDAPWTDPDAPESYDFYGLYPLDVAGLEDSSGSAAIVESLGHGGTPGRLRFGTKSVVFNVMLLAATDAAADYGVRWLKQALLGSACGSQATASCNGAPLCFLSSTPEIDIPDPTPGQVFAGISGGDADDIGDLVVGGGDLDSVYHEVIWGGDADEEAGYISVPQGPFDFTPPKYVPPADCLDHFLRSLSRVVFTSPPKVTSKREIRRTGHQVWTLTFTATAGSPWILGAEQPVIEGFLDPNVSVPWVGGEMPSEGALDIAGFMYSDEPCLTPDYQPIFDPLHPAVVPPPGPPPVPLGAFSPPVAWRRRQFTLPRQFVPLWGEVVPKVTVHARTADTRNLRLRFYADPYQVGDTSDDPCAYCGDIIVSYVPEGYSLILDGSTEAVYAVAPGGARQRADSLVFASDGTPFEWPSLTCGFGYVVTIDLPETQAPPVIDLSLFSRTS